MKNNLVHLLRSMCQPYLGAAIFIIVFSFPLPAQIFSDQQLLERGISAYEQDNFTRAAMYLFAYIQRGPELMQTDRTHANQVRKALEFAQNPQNQGGAASAKGDYIRGPKPRLNKPRRSSRRSSSRNYSLTGTWRCNDGGSYFIRQEGNDIWWYGRSSDGGRAWANVFRGQIHGDKISGKWADVPHGRARGSGAMSLKIVNSRKLRALQKTGGFGGSQWTR